MSSRLEEVLKMDLSWIGKRLSKNQKPLVEKKKSMEKVLDEAIETVKTIIMDLRPSMLDDLGLIAALDWLSEDFQNRSGIKCEFSQDPEEIIVNQELATAIFRIVQEALTNVARHADTTNVKISLTDKACELLLKVSDDGKGITEDQISDSKSFGLIGIRERAHGFGGDVKIEGVSGEGTMVEVRIPVGK